MSSLKRSVTEDNNWNDKGKANGSYAALGQAGGMDNGECPAEYFRIGEPIQ
jgi:hypothetical protein